MRCLILFLCLGLVSCGASYIDELLEEVTFKGQRVLKSVLDKRFALVSEADYFPGENKLAVIWIEAKSGDNKIRQKCANNIPVGSPYYEKCRRYQAEHAYRELYYIGNGESNPPWRAGHEKADYWDSFPMMPTDEELVLYGFERVEGYPRAFRRLGK